METVSDESHALYRFEYSRRMPEPGYDPYLLTGIMDGDWKLLLQNRYSLGRVFEQRLAGGQIYRYEYALRGSDVLATTITLPSGEKKIFGFRDGKFVATQ